MSSLDMMTSVKNPSMVSGIAIQRGSVVPSVRVAVPDCSALLKELPSYLSWAAADSHELVGGIYASERCETTAAIAKSITLSSTRPLSYNSRTSARVGRAGGSEGTLPSRSMPCPRLAYDNSETLEGVSESLVGVSCQQCEGIVSGL